MSVDNVTLTREKPTNESPVLYTATGWVAGTYQPSPDKFYHGVLVTQDNQAIPAELHWRLRNQLKRKHPGVCYAARVFP